MLAQLEPGVVEQAQRGDAQAFSAIVRLYQTPVFNYILRTVGDHELAEDLTQEVFLRVLRSLPRYGHRAKFTTWLFQVAKNLMLDEFRARSCRPQCVESDPELTPFTADPPIEQTETIGAIWLAVGQLNLDLKTALLLRDVAGLSYDEMADTLDVTLATVKWRIWKARDTVRRSAARAGVVHVAAATDPPSLAAAASA